MRDKSVGNTKARTKRGARCTFFGPVCTRKKKRASEYTCVCVCVCVCVLCVGVCVCVLCVGKREPARACTRKGVRSIC